MVSVFYFKVSSGSFVYRQKIYDTFNHDEKAKKKKKREFLILFSFYTAQLTSI